MKFTRFFILKVLTHRHISVNPNEANFIEIFKEVIVNHPYIDMMLSLILSLVIMLTKFTDDSILIYECINYYLIVKLNITTLIYYFFYEHLDGLNVNDNSIPKLFTTYYHTFKGILYFVKNILCITSYFLSIIYCYIYGYQKLTINKEDFLAAHILILEFFNFYCAFRFCYFLIKIVANVCLIPLYFTSIFLGVVEDNFNKQLNNVVNTQQYTGRSSIRSQGRLSEIDESCSICLISFNIDDYTSTLPCSRRHTFHTKCLEKWFLTTVSCPLCRSDFQSSIELNIINDNPREISDFNQRLL
jgi:hypothetical protein